MRLPARRAACRSLGPGAAGALLGGAERLYVASREGDGRGVVDVVDERGGLIAELPVQWPEWGGPADGAFTLGSLLLEDATGHPPRVATVNAFVEEVLAAMEPEGFALSSSEICAWLLLRAIARADQG